MPNSFKVSILELDGVEFEYPVEYDADQLLSELGYYKEAGFPFREFCCGLLAIDFNCFSTLDGGEIGLTYKRTICADGGNL